LKNKLVNGSGQAIEFTPTIFTTSAFPITYNPSAYSKVVDDDLNEFLVKNADKEQRMKFEEALGTIFFDRDLLVKRAYVDLGRTNSCKSMVMGEIIKILGSDNCSTLLTE
jgi:hypothetical protein